MNEQQGNDGPCAASAAIREIGDIRQAIDTVTCLVEAALDQGEADSHMSAEKRRGMALARLAVEKAQAAGDQLGRVEARLSARVVDRIALMSAAGRRADVPRRACCG